MAKNYNRRRSSGGAANTILWVLVIFLLIGFLGSLFSGAPINPDLDATKPPVADVTDPTDGALTFTVSTATGPKSFPYDEGMTWSEFVNSGYNDGTFKLAFGKVQFAEYSMDLNNGSATVVESDVIDPSLHYGP